MVNSVHPISCLEPCKPPAGCWHMAALVQRTRHGLVGTIINRSIKGALWRLTLLRPPCLYITVAVSRFLKHFNSLGGKWCRMLSGSSHTSVQRESMLPGTCSRALTESFIVECPDHTDERRQRALVLITPVPIKWHNYLIIQLTNRWSKMYLQREAAGVLL